MNLVKVCIFTYNNDFKFIILKEKIMKKGIIISVFLLLLSTHSILAQNASGIYQSDFNEMTLQQSGNQVSGTYKHSDGRIEGTLSGTTLSGWWTQSNGKGRIVFVFSPDFSSFTGKWGYDNA